jgi:NAD(P)-dependent dehydrogenase (short-subunit alcohol dehydrogenase family)
MSSLEGRVAVVTGAAHGLGRCHALTLASLGARVVVNDLGTAADGQGRDESAARAVVEEIRQAGGEAAAHFGDVADWNDAQSLVQTAVDRFGSLDILILNAGFTRDAVIFNMSEQDFDSVVRVHLKGHFAPMKFASMYWREKSKREGGPIYGRLLSTASESFLFGTPGQPNYAAAKAGIVSLTMGAAKLLFKYGVTANVVMPRARTRMTLQGPMGAIFQKPEEGFDNFDPNNSTPLFAYLCTPEARRITAHVFIVWGKQVQVMARPAKAATFDSDAVWTPDSLHQQLGPYFEKLEPITDGYPVPEM